MTERPNLAQLQDLALPAAISPWPQTPLALSLSLLLVLTLLGLVCLQLRRWRSNRYRRSALATLDALQRHCTADPARLTELPTLLKLAALQAWPRESVAALSGPDWLAFIQQQCPGHRFPEVLGELAYWPPERILALGQGERSALLQSARVWLKHHVRP